MEYSLEDILSYNKETNQYLTNTGKTIEEKDLIGKEVFYGDYKDTLIKEANDIESVSSTLIRAWKDEFHTFDVDMGNYVISYRYVILKRG